MQLFDSTAYTIHPKRLFISCHHILNIDRVSHYITSAVAAGPVRWMLLQLQCEAQSTRFGVVGNQPTLDRSLFLAVSTDFATTTAFSYISGTVVAIMQHYWTGRSIHGGNNLGWSPIIAYNLWNNLWTLNVGLFEGLWAPKICSALTQLSIVILWSITTIISPNNEFKSYYSLHRRTDHITLLYNRQRL